VRALRATAPTIKLLGLALAVAVASLSLPASAAAAGLSTSSRIVAPPRVSEGQVVRYLVPKYNGRYSDADVRWIVGRYFDVAPGVGVEPLVALAQMSHETAHLSSYWSQRPRRNPAGIGVTGRRGEGESFPRWRDSVDAHVGRLLAYALPRGAGTARQKRLIAVALSWRPLPDRYRGSARTIYGLQGRWASDRRYASKLAQVGDAIDATP
jgi:Mannosyl-glycoprotein endo-beta-N-acetylglucosaminidase